MLFSLQSFLVPLQGFLNAIVYGWTREDFTKELAIAQGTHHSEREDWQLQRYQAENHTSPTNQETESEINNTYNAVHHHNIIEEDSLGSDSSDEQHEV